MRLIIFLLLITAAIRIGLVNPEEPIPQERWQIKSYTWKDHQEFNHDWNRDGITESLDAVFLGAGAQSHYNIVLKEGMTGKEIISTYAFNMPHYGYFHKEKSSPVIFIRVLGKLKEVLDAPLDAIPYPAPAESCTAIAFCYTYYRLIDFHEGSFRDASGVYPELLWHLITEHELKTFTEAGEKKDKLIELCLDLLYFQVRTGSTVQAEWLKKALPGNCKVPAKEILSCVEQLAKKKANLVKYFALEKRAVLSNQ